MKGDFIELETSENVTEATLRAIHGVTEVRTQGKTWILRATSAEEVLPNLLSHVDTHDIRGSTSRDPASRRCSWT